MIKVTKQTILVEEQGEVNTFGIASESGLAIENVCIAEHELQQFVDTLNTLEVSDLHLLDVIEDFLLQR